MQRKKLRRRVLTGLMALCLLLDLAWTFEQLFDVPVFKPVKRTHNVVQTTANNGQNTDKRPTNADAVLAGCLVFAAGGCVVLVLALHGGGREKAAAKRRASHARRLPQTLRGLRRRIVREPAVLGRTELRTMDCADIADAAARALGKCLEPPHAGLGEALSWFLDRARTGGENRLLLENALEEAGVFPRFALWLRGAALNRMKAETAVRVLDFAAFFPAHFDGEILRRAFFASSGELEAKIIEAVAACAGTVYADSADFALKEREIRGALEENAAEAERLGKAYREKRKEYLLSRMRSQGERTLESDQAVLEALALRKKLEWGVYSVLEDAAEIPLAAVIFHILFFSYDDPSPEAADIELKFKEGSPPALKRAEKKKKYQELFRRSAFAGLDRKKNAWFTGMLDSSWRSLVKADNAAKARGMLDTCRLFLYVYLGIRADGGPGPEDGISPDDVRPFLDSRFRLENLTRQNLSLAEAGLALGTL